MHPIRAWIDSVFHHNKLGKSHSCPAQRMGTYVRSPEASREIADGIVRENGRNWGGYK